MSEENIYLIIGTCKTKPKVPFWGIMQKWQYMWKVGHIQLLYICPTVSIRMVISILNR